MSLYHKNGKLLLMGSSKYKAKNLPVEIREKIDRAIHKDMTIIVAEAHGSCRLYQDYLAEKQYENVIVGHARSIRYNAGNWKDVKYGDNLKERELNMIMDCNSAIVIWQDNSGVIAENLENLKNLGKPTYLYEYHSTIGTVYSGMLDPDRIYKTLFPYQR